MPPAGRNKSFDETQVLERAMDAFWERGYRGIGLTELLDRMGISRQSLYDTFGGKRELFLRVIDHYRATQLAQALELLERDGNPIDNVKAVVRAFEGLAADRRCRGCLVANTLVELGPHDVEIAARLQETLDLLQGGIRKALRQAQKRGELPAARSPLELSRALTSAVIGLSVTGKLPVGRAVLRDIYTGTVSMLD